MATCNACAKAFARRRLPALGTESAPSWSCRGTVARTISWRWTRSCTAARASPRSCAGRTRRASFVTLAPPSSTTACATTAVCSAWTTRSSSYAPRYVWRRAVAWRGGCVARSCQRPQVYLANDGNYRELRWFTPWNESVRAFSFLPCFRAARRHGCRACVMLVCGVLLACAAPAEVRQAGGARAP